MRMKKSAWIIFWSMIVLLILAISVYFMEQSKDITDEFAPNKPAEESLNDLIVDQENEEISNIDYIEDESVLASSQKTIEIKCLDEGEKEYSFVYKDEAYIAVFLNGSWCIKDSYRVRNKEDMVVICKALIDIHQVQSRDGNSYRTAEDMAYEWMQHNIAYEILPDDNKWKDNAKDVDLDPADQGKSIQEIYEAKTGKRFNIKDIISN